jgi:hypothetical protein
MKKKYGRENLLTDLELFTVLFPIVGLIAVIFLFGVLPEIFVMWASLGLWCVSYWDLSGTNPRWDYVDKEFILVFPATIGATLFVSYLLRVAPHII